LPKHRADKQTGTFPTGTVTFLFTDIEGSTKLVQELGARWVPILERHRELLRAAIQGAGGIEVQTEGDAFFAVFKTAGEAVAAAAEGQKRLAAERWPEGATIAVRMGLHSGEGLLDADDSYVGADVHRAARVAAAAHGGQVVLSATTRALLGEALPGGVGLVDLGEHRLKDLRAERLSQLSIAGLRNAFPPLEAIDLQPNNLPTQLTSFVGREAELQRAGELLDRTRLLTLTGPGGTGKTRLSIQLAATQSGAFPEGLWFAALEPIRDPELVASTIAHVLGISLASGRRPLDLVGEWIGDKRMLLVLDNFEQVIDAAPTVAELLRACPHLKIVCTSRSTLRVSGEQEYQVPGLPAPPDLSRLTPMQLEALPDEALHPAIDTLNQYEAVRLFIARAVAVRADFAVTNDNAPSVAQICARLHGMPLAIELAAARVKLLTPQQILDRLEHQLSLLTSGSRDLPERQQTLRGAIAWSYDLLDDGLKRLLARLSVFSGGWDLDAAEAIAGSGGGDDVLDGLSAVVDQSLARREEENGSTRFEMLPTIRDFLREMLTEKDEMEAIADRHAAYYLALVEEASPHLHGDRQREWMDRLEKDHDNLRAAIDWAAEKPDPETAVRLGFAMWRFWQQRGYVTEARRRLEALLVKNWTLPDELHARLLEAAGGVAYWQADHDAAVRWYAEALAIWRRVGDKKEIANAIYNYSYGKLVPVIRGQRKMSTAELEDARKACDEALLLFREAGDRVGEGNIAWALGTLHHFHGDYETSRKYFSDSIALFHETGQRTMEAWGRHMMTLPLVRLGRLDEATESARGALSHFDEAGDLSGVAMVLRYLSGLAMLAGDNQKAAVLYGAAEKLLIATGAGLTAYLYDVFLERDPAKILSKAEFERWSKEGAAMPLAKVVAYGMEDAKGADQPNA
jgi:predicted ATPase/class 3 adenylate cyclase